MQPIFLACSTFILGLLFYGLKYRRQPKVHVPVMLTSFGLDVLLVLAIEITRHAVEKAFLSTNDTLLMFHVGISTSTLVLYTVLSILGFRILKGNTGALLWHRRMALLFVTCRLTNYVTSFWIG